MNRHARIDYCLVSQQATPNVLPYLDPDFRPDMIVLVTSPEMKQQAEALRGVLEDQLAVAMLEIPNAYDYDGMVEQLHDDIQRRLPAGQEAWLNITGGTKPMALAAYQAFTRATAGRIYYLNVRDNTVEWFDQHPSREPQRLKAALDLELLLRAHGYTSKPPKQTSDVHRAVADSIGTRCASLVRAIGAANAVVRAEKRWRHKTELPLEQKEWEEASPFLQHFIDADLARWDGSTLTLTGDRATQTLTRDALIKSSWLETYVEGVVRAIVGAKNMTAGLKVIDRRGVENELDVVALVDDRLNLIECKTGVPGEKGANDAMYKLASLQDRLGGIRTRSAVVLVSVRDWTEASTNRASGLGITLIHGAAVENLSTTLREWLLGTQSVE